jgi:hypothetical protein
MALNQAKSCLFGRFLLTTARKERTMETMSEQVNDKTKDSGKSAVHLTNKSTTRPSCFSSCPARHIEDCLDCHFTNECHAEFNRILFYSE